ncbi:MAG: FAD binding domain-containing protein [Candidatus Eisenbacteria bacterium]
MRTAVSTLSVKRPRDLKQALRMLADSLAGERLIPLAGGTDLFVYLNAGTQQGTRFLDLGAVQELRGVRMGRDGGVTLGARENFRDLQRHAALKKAFPSLIAAAAQVGAEQIQNRATLAGNIANASPAGDSLPVLLAHDALVHASSVRGARVVRFAELYTGYRQLALAPDELITAIELPPTPARCVHFFRKVGTRAAQSISKVVFAGVLRVGRNGVDHVRLAWGSVAATTVRSAGAEAELLGASPSRQVGERARTALGTDITPIDDVRSEGEYRLEVAGNVLAQFLRAAHAGFARD